MRSLTLVLAFTFVSSYDPENKYCRLSSCPNGSHTMCIYNKEGLSSTCGTRLPSRLSKTDEKMTILNAHNDYRTKVYLGNEFEGIAGPQPSAIKVTFLEWNEELAQIAQRWSDQCIIDKDICRNTGDFKVGQNYVFDNYVVGIDRSLEMSILKLLVKKWYDEVKNFDRINVDSFSTASSIGSLNYTQIVWEKSIELGCGVTRYADSEDIRIFLVCNYGPSGNHDGEPIYLTAV